MMTLQELSDRISTATGPGNVLDNAIDEYLSGDPYRYDSAAPYTTDVSRALTLAAEQTPGLSLMLLKHPNGMWSLAASDDGVPQFDDTLFDEQYLALSIVATVFETLVDRAARQQ